MLKCAKQTNNPTFTQSDTPLGTSFFYNQEHSNVWGKTEYTALSVIDYLNCSLYQFNKTITLIAGVGSFKWTPPPDLTMWPL